MTANTKKNNARSSFAERQNSNFAEKLTPIRFGLLGIPRLPGEWGADGEDHINIAPYAATELGKFLSPNRRLGIQHPILGSFTSLMNLWHYLKARYPVDDFRDAPAGQLMTMLHQSGGGFHPTTIENLDYILADGLWSGVKRNDKLKMLLKQSSLPFDIYQTNEAGLRMRSLKQTWILAIATEIRKAVKENREPDFSSLSTTDDPYEPLRKRLGLPSPAELRARAEAAKQTSQQPAKPAEAPRTAAGAGKKSKRRGDRDGATKRPVIQDVDSIVEVKAGEHGIVSESPISAEAWFASRPSNSTATSEQVTQRPVEHALEVKAGEQMLQRVESDTQALQNAENDMGFENTQSNTPTPEPEVKLVFDETRVDKLTTLKDLREHFGRTGEFALRLADGTVVMGADVIQDSDSALTGVMTDKLAGQWVGMVQTVTNDGISDGGIRAFEEKLDEVADIIDGEAVEVVVNREPSLLTASEVTVVPVEEDGTVIADQ